MEKFIIHLHLYLSDKENEYIAYQNLKKLKQHGFKILITSPKPLPEYLYEFIDFFCYDKENQLLTREYENIEPTILWTRSGDTELRFVTVKQQRHGLAVLRAMIKGCKLASAYGFEYIVRFEYDDCFGPQSMKLIESGLCSCYAIHLSLLVMPIYQAMSILSFFLNIFMGSITPNS